MNGQTFLDLVMNEDGTVKPLVVKFNKNIGDWEGYFDTNMKARLVNVVRTNDKEVFTVVFKVEEFDEHNSKVEVCNYWNGTGDAIWSARQAGMHPERNEWCEDVYLDIQSEVPFDIIDDKAKQEAIQQLMAIVNEWESWDKSGLIIELLTDCVDINRIKETIKRCS